MGYYTKEISDNTFEAKYDLKRLLIEADAIHKLLLLISSSLDTIIALQTVAQGSQTQKGPQLQPPQT